MPPEFHTKTMAPNQLWQTDFTYLKFIGWGQAILLDRVRIKRRTIQHRRLMHHQKAA